MLLDYKMKETLKKHYLQELQSYQTARSTKNYSAAWNHLERAHILGQFDWRAHFYVHVLMFGLGLKTLEWREIIGQIPRILLAIPGSLTGKAPIGNVGTSRVGIFTPMSIPADLERLIKD